MNLPGNKIHHIEGGYGRLVLPWFGGRWLIWFFGSQKYDALPRGFRLMNRHFHNCTATGVY